MNDHPTHENAHMAQIGEENQIPRGSAMARANGGPLNAEQTETLRHLRQAGYRITEGKQEGRPVYNVRTKAGALISTHGSIASLLDHHRLQRMNQPEQPNEVRAGDLAELLSTEMHEAIANLEADGYWLYEIDGEYGIGGLENPAGNGIVGRSSDPRDLLTAYLLYVAYGDLAPARWASTQMWLQDRGWEFSHRTDGELTKAILHGGELEITEPAPICYQLCLAHTWHSEQEDRIVRVAFRLQDVARGRGSFKQIQIAEDDSGTRYWIVDPETTTRSYTRTLEAAVDAVLGDTPAIEERIKAGKVQIAVGRREGRTNDGSEIAGLPEPEEAVESAHGDVAALLDLDSLAADSGLDAGLVAAIANNSLTATVCLQKIKEQAARIDHLTEGYISLRDLLGNISQAPGNPADQHIENIAAGRMVAQANVRADRMQARIDGLQDLLVEYDERIARNHDEIARHKSAIQGHAGRLLTHAKDYKALDLILAGHVSTLAEIARRLNTLEEDRSDQDAITGRHNRQIADIEEALASLRYEKTVQAAVKEINEQAGGFKLIRLQIANAAKDREAIKDAIGTRLSGIHGDIAALADQIAAVDKAAEERLAAIEAGQQAKEPPRGMNHEEMVAADPLFAALADAGYTLNQYGDQFTATGHGRVVTGYSAEDLTTAVEALNEAQQQRQQEAEEAEQPAGHTPYYAAIQVDKMRTLGIGSVMQQMHEAARAGWRVTIQPDHQYHVIYKNLQDSATVVQGADQLLAYMHFARQRDDQAYVEPLDGDTALRLYNQTLAGWEIIAPMHERTTWRAAHPEIDVDAPGNRLEASTPSAMAGMIEQWSQRD